jgi:hypothetical protein
LIDSRTGLPTKVAWVEDGYDGRHSRSKQLDTVEHALTYKQLVEVNEGKLPTYRQLASLGLEEFGYDINPKVVLLMQEIAHRNISDTRKVELLTCILDQL